MALSRIYFGFFRCNNRDQFLKYIDIIKILNVANDVDIYKMTNCLSKCDKNAYRSKIEATYLNEDPRLQNTIRVEFYYASVEHEVREQVSNRAAFSNQSISRKNVYSST